MNAMTGGAALGDGARDMRVRAGACSRAASRSSVSRRGAGPEPVTVRGVTYPGAQAAAAALGVTVNAIYAARERGRLDGVGQSGRRGPPLPVGQNPGNGLRVGYQVFVSQVACALHFGVTASAVSRLRKADRLADLLLTPAQRNAQRVQNSAATKRLRVQLGLSVPSGALADLLAQLSEKEAADYRVLTRVGKYSRAEALALMKRPDLAARFGGVA